MCWLYHASFDPYNTTEFMDWTWTNLLMEWTNGMVKFVNKKNLYNDILGRSNILLWCKFFSETSYGFKLI